MGVQDTWAYFSMGIMSLFAYLVPHVSIEIGKYRRAVSKSAHWAATDERLEEAYGHILRSGACACITFLVLISLVATAVALTTKGLDPRMVSIIAGMSKYMASVIFLFLSRKVPKWTQFYFTSRKERHESERVLGSSDKVLKYHVFGSVGYQFMKVFFNLLPFYCGANAAIIPFSAIIGVMLGFAIDASIYLSRRERRKQRLRITICIVLVLFCSGLAMFLYGTFYIIDVWGVQTARGRAVAGSVMGIIYTVLAAAMHGTMWYWTKRHKEENRPDATVMDGRPDLTTAVSKPLPSSRDRLATSLMMSKLGRRKQRPVTSNGEPASVPSMPQIAESESNEESLEDEDNVGPEQVIYPQHTDKQSIINDEENAVNEGNDDEESDPTYRQLICESIRCKKKNEEEAEELGKFDRCLDILNITLSVLVALGFVFFVVINIGAQTQANSTFALLGPAQQQLYGSFNNGTVCAFDDRGPLSNITSFANKTEAHKAGFKVLHCGGCGECSKWENLRIEWATRKYLAEESARCAKKSLFGGGGAVNSCLEKPPIAFEGECAWCWTRDILCTKKHCAFIYLQSNLINTVGNFAVEEGQITSAVCEEANCELEDGHGSGEMGFVECSGATRRRMNIVSSIERPKWQQCTIVDVDFDDLFGDCCDNGKDFRETYPIWEELDEMELQWNQV